jgi:multidrug resistance efflux pump
LKKINILYWLVLPFLLFLCYYILNGYDSKIADFFGYTENKETEINLDYSAVVDKIHVMQGQQVKKGDLLLEMSKKSFDKEIENLNQSIAILNNKNSINAAEIRTAIEKVIAEKSQKIGQLKNEVAIEESKLTYNKSLLSSNVTVGENEKLIHPIQEKINSLKKEIDNTESSSNKIIDAYNLLLQKMRSTDVEAKTYLTSKDYIIEERNKLKILAPFDGLIGNINVKGSEFVQAFTPLLSFYEKSPGNVVGYVHESLSLKINTGDSVILHSQHIAKGVVSGKGHRIIEIPERLRKIPEYKTYGMEVFIQIPRNNIFLQKETVSISPLKSQNLLFSHD